MSAYVLILTLLINTGEAAVGGLTSIDMPTREACEREGQIWANRVGEALRSTNRDEVVYTCIKRGRG